MKGKRLFVGLLWVFIFAVLLTAQASAVFAEWTIEGVDAPKNFSVASPRGIAIDEVTNKPHIVYGGDNLFHAYLNGTQWQYETVDSSPGVGQYAAIAIDSNGKVHISYFDDMNDDLKYATNASGVWVISTIDSAGVGEYTSIAIDSNNKVHISYYDATNGDLKYATNASDLWVTSTVDSTVHVGQYAAIAIDLNNKVHISYYDTTNSDLKYATNASGSWITSTIDSTGSVGSYTSIALDSNNKAHISYHDATNYDLKYATNASGSWVISTIDAEGNTGQYPSIAIGTNNKVYISYRAYISYDLKYATNASGSWVISTVDYSTGYVGNYTSIALDVNNKAHISYFDDTNQYLKYATNAGGAWVKSVIDYSGGDIGQYSSITVDTNNKAHISYFDYTNDDLKYATNASGVWVTYTIDSAGPLGKYTSIALDSNNKVHISYFEDTYDSGTAIHDLRYATNASGMWAIYVIDGAMDDVGWYTSIAVDSNNKAHISYYDGTAGSNGDLKYATNASGSWVTSTIDSTGWVGEYTSIAIDSNDKVHISYNDVSNTALKYATNVSGTWTASTLYLAGSSGLFTSIAIDSNDKVHISHWDAQNYSFLYTTNALGPWWYTETIDSVGYDDVTGTSIAIDTNNKVHISYNDGTGNSGVLKYATNTSGAWAASAIDSVGSWGGYSSIAVDSNNNVQISYYVSYPFYDLKYATNTPSCTDNDTDGYAVEGGGCGAVDCDDSSSSVYPGAPDVICDGIDNNCDGIADDGYTPTNTTCGIGACSSTGELICSGGTLIDTCTPETPGTEGPYSNSTCSDATDNDCDGATDSADSNCQAVDLIEISVSNPPTTAAVGSSFQVSDTVKNRGNIASGASSTRFYLSTDRRKDAADKRLAGRLVPALNPGASSRGRLNVTVPTTTQSGTYYLLACADDTNKVAEGNELNNCRTSAATVLITP